VLPPMSSRLVSTRTPTHTRCSATPDACTACQRANSVIQTLNERLAHFCAHVEKLCAQPPDVETFVNTLQQSVHQLRRVTSAINCPAVSEQGMTLVRTIV
jgi:hypothetical protein